jgi:hypothetical protein
MLFMFSFWPPEDEARVHNPDYGSHPFRSRVERRVLQDVFIQNIHAPAGSNPSSWAWLRKASLARRTASEIACSPMLPRHSSTIAGHAMPLATCSSTSATRFEFL